MRQGRRSDLSPGARVSVAAASTDADAGAALEVLLIEPYAAGSHRQWMRGLQGSSRHRIRVLAQPGRFWKWRMHGAAPSAALAIGKLSRQEAYRPDVVLASDMLDLAALLGIARAELEQVPVVLYMHENQLGYPAQAQNPDWDASRRRRERPDMHYPFVNLTSMLAADAVWWNSAHNRDSFLDALPAFLRGFPDERLTGMSERVLEKSRIVPIGLSLAGLARRSADVEGSDRRTRGSRPVILWNHRWEYDKDPEAFFAALETLDARGREFDLVLVGESFSRKPSAFEAARERFGDRILQYGHVSSRADYEGWLLRSDFVVSSAKHEFFGAAVCEAIAAGCRPLLPARLSYPEIIPSKFHDRVLYGGENGLVSALELALDEWLSESEQRLREGLRSQVLRYDWTRMSARYDALLVDVQQRSGYR